MKKDFNKIALQSNLFKGHSVWYVVYLKTERLAHVLSLLEQRSTSPTPLFSSTLERAAEIPSTIVSLLAGELREEIVLARIFSVITLVRLLLNRAVIGKENATLIIQEYEGIVERITNTNALFEAFITPEHVAVPPLVEMGYSQSLPIPLSGSAHGLIRDIKGHDKGHQSSSEKDQKGHMAQESRGPIILEIIRKNKGISIKGISAIVRDCSEKTIQRELGGLIARGLIVREGERRWSIYKSVQTP